MALLRGFRNDGFGAAYLVSSLATLDWGCLILVKGRAVPPPLLELLVVDGFDISRAAICRVTVPTEAISLIVARVGKFN